MVHHQQTTASVTVFHLIDTNTVILADDGSMLLAHERDQIPEFLVRFVQKDYWYLSSQTGQNSKLCSVYTNELGLTYISKLVEIDTEKHETYRWVIGPFLMQMPDMDKIVSIVHAELNDRHVLQQFIQNLKLFSNSKIQSAINLLGQIGFLHENPYRIIDLHSQRVEGLERSDMLFALQHPDEHDTKFIEIKYELEKEMMNAVEHGDKLKMTEIMTESMHWHDFSTRFPNQPVRAMKNMLVILNTILRIAAERGKVHPFFLHHLSEKFSKQIERSESINSLEAIIEIMYNEYCDLVKSRAVSGYSHIVQKAAQHMSVHFSQPFNLKQLAEYCLVHPSHLSRQFKKETGMTLTDFQNKQRINEAKLLLKEGRTSIDRIAGYVGFDDAGYFSRIFKKLEGMTPTQYMNSN